MDKRQTAGQNQFETKPLGRLMLKFAIPAITSSLITAAYNITDQVFIGRGIGYLGNAATNIAFPLYTLSMAVSISLGVGSASNFNLRMGEGKKEDAAQVIGVGLTLMAIIGLCIGFLSFIFIKPLIYTFGATEQIFPYAVEYTRIIAPGIPLVLFTSGCSYIIRADGNPTASMVCVATGAILNTFLDPLFIFVFHWGIAGAAYATIIGQFVSFLLTVSYLRKLKSVPLASIRLGLKAKWVIAIAKIGSSPFFNHFMTMIVQVTLNNMLRAYGAFSVYGGDIPIAVVGVVSKINVIVTAFTIGIALGCQPIFGYNYGAKNYARVKATFIRAAAMVLFFSIVAFSCFQLFPRQIVSIFGTGNELYFQFAERYMRIYMMLVCVFGLQPLTSMFFSSIGKPYKGLFITMTRQGLFSLPLLLILPRFLGLDGIVYAGPASDASAVLLAVIFAAYELNNITKLEKAR